LLRSYIPVLEEEIEEIKEFGLMLTWPNGKEVHAILVKAIMSMIDGKMVNRLTQLGGSYCTMCEVSAEDCNKVTLSRISIYFGTVRTHTTQKIYIVVV
jgi:hypothetical protein